MRTSLREGSGMVSRGSVGLLPAQKKRAGWGTIAWLDLRIAVTEVGEGKGQVKGASLSLNNHAGSTPGVTSRVSGAKNYFLRLRKAFIPNQRVNGVPSDKGARR